MTNEKSEETRSRSQTFREIAITVDYAIIIQKSRFCEKKSAYRLMKQKIFKKIQARY